MLSPVRKKSVVATSEEDAPFRVKLSLSSFTEYIPEAAPRKPETDTAVPSDSSADERSERRVQDTNHKRTGKIEIDKVPSMSRSVIRIV